MPFNPLFTSLGQGFTIALIATKEQFPEEFILHLNILDFGCYQRNKNASRFRPAYRPCIEGPARPNTRAFSIRIGKYLNENQ